MPRRAVVLLSGGLDSMLAVRVLLEQGIDVEALNVRMPFSCCPDQAAAAARELDVRLTVVDAGDDYLEVIRRPRHGYGRGANPCVDCRIHLFALAGRFLRQCGADFVASGEVVGQRPMSQKKRDLAVIAYRSGLDNLLVRPLSAKSLPPTRPEREGWVDRERLFGIVGRGRKELITLARGFGFQRIPQPSTGCQLSEPGFAPKVRDLVQLQPAPTRWDYELLKLGRHVRYDAAAKIVLGRREEENRALEHLFARPDAGRATLLVPNNFVGPTALLIGEATAESLAFAGGLILRYGRQPDESPRVRWTRDGETGVIDAAEHAGALAAATL